MMTSAGNAVLAHMKIPTDAMKTSLVNVKQLSKCLSAKRRKADDISAEVFAVWKDSKSITESCKRRKGQHNSTISNNQMLEESVQDQILSVDSEISMLEADIALLNLGAEEFDNRASAPKTKRRFWGMFGRLYPAPVTGKASPFVLFFRVQHLKPRFALFS